MREYKHSQKLKAEEMRHKTQQAKMRAEMEEKEKMNEKICDFIDEAIETEQSKADYIYGKGAKGKMDVNINLSHQGKIFVKALFTPAEGVKPLEGRSVFGLVRTVKW